MHRRFTSGSVLVLMVALVASVAVSVRAASERATFILTNGDRISGPVVFHGRSRENLVDGYMSLGAENGRERSVPVDQVAVIDFVGGRPQRAELQALPFDSRTQVLALRNGSMQPGTFVNMLGGDTLVWQSPRGQRRRYAIRDVSRVYLNLESARAVWDVRGGRDRNGPPVAFRGTSDADAIRVEASQPWTETGVIVRRGDRLAFFATGEIRFSRDSGAAAGPDGNGRTRSAGYPVSAMSLGGLIGQVGNSAPFPIGSNTRPIAMPADGRLRLGVNDNERNDNSGYFAVVITRP